MKQRCAAALFLMIFCLFGCHKGQTIAYPDLRITLPEEYMDLSSEPYASGTDFFYGKERLILSGFAENHADLNNCTLAAYTELLILGNELGCIPEQTDNGYRFSYQAPVMDNIYHYEVGIYSSQERFWIIQCYCPAEDQPVYAEEIARIFDAIQILG